MTDTDLGGVIFPIFVPKMIAQHGFAAAVRWTALLMGCMLVIAILTVKKPPFSQAQQSQAHNPEWWRDLLSAGWLFFLPAPFWSCAFVRMLFKLRD